jgi:hypothetical protein
VRPALSRHRALLLLAALVLAGSLLAVRANAATAPEDPTQPTGEPPISALPYVVAAHNVRPDKSIRVHRYFRPWAHPSPEQVQEIINSEQRLWGGPSISGRVACESNYDWSATNGQYQGLLQIGPWWSDAYAVTPRRVRLVSHKTSREPVYRVRRFSDGSRERERIRTAPVTKTIIRTGTLPADAAPYHGWAAIRVGQRAVSGAGPSTAWSCGL